MPTEDQKEGITYAPVEKYLHDLLRPRGKVLSELEADAAKHSVPIIGPLCGNVLWMLARAIKAKRILEIGTATGYSGIWLASALLSQGKLVTVEYDPGRAKAAAQSFKKAGLAKKVEILQGNAKIIVPKLAKKKPGSLDLVLLDVGEKTLYVDLLEPCIRLLRRGGFLLADNVLWSGFVADPKDHAAETEIIRKFNKKVYLDPRLHPTLIPLRDGLMVAQKVR